MNILNKILPTYIQDTKDSDIANITNIISNKNIQNIEKDHIDKNIYLPLCYDIWHQDDIYIVLERVLSMLELSDVNSRLILLEHATVSKKTVPSQVKEKTDEIVKLFEILDIQEEDEVVNLPKRLEANRERISDLCATPSLNLEVLESAIFLSCLPIETFSKSFSKIVSSYQEQVLKVNNAKIASTKEVMNVMKSDPELVKRARARIEEVAPRKHEEESNISLKNLTNYLDQLTASNQSKPAVSESLKSVKEYSDALRTFRVFEKSEKSLLESKLIKKDILKPKNIIKMNESVTVKSLAKAMDMDAVTVLETAEEWLDIPVTLLTPLTNEEAQSVAELFEKTLEFKSSSSCVTLRARVPVVTIMGHVDHGKTTLLDSLYQSAIVKSEKGGITQRVSAFAVPIDMGIDMTNSITFIDTPGHAVFSQMRERGANCTDIVVLVVAADDGVKPQTIEAVKHAKAARVPIIVALNKIDKPGSEPSKIQYELQQHQLVSEKLGGTVQFVEISALEKTGLEDLLMAIVLEQQQMDERSKAEHNVAHFVADYDAPLKASILERRFDNTKGSTLSIIVSEGTLRKGDSVYTGTAHGRVKKIIDSTGKQVKMAVPGMPVEILGINFGAATQAGDLLRAGSSKEIHEAVEATKFEHMTTKLQEETHGDHLDDMERFEEDLKLNPTKAYSNLSKGALYRAWLNKPKIRKSVISETVVTDIKPTKKSISFIIKANEKGSLDAINSIINAFNEKNDTNYVIIHEGIGNVTPSDVERAKLANGIIFGFGVDTMVQFVGHTPESERCPIRLQDVIYRFHDDLKEIEEFHYGDGFVYELTGRGKVVKSLEYQISKRETGTVAVVDVVEGFVDKANKHQLYRKGEKLHPNGKLHAASIKKFEKKIDRAEKGDVVGIILQTDGDLRDREPVTDIEEGDELRAYHRKHAPSLFNSFRQRRFTLEKGRPSK
eukprot:GHVL01001869.1.p1 GENE.GHVL01001869.1~~GHVL01001869.1.p1  ORF type:complete len:1080 (-),score=265.20 GHVL01001869.1:184-3033(-)